MCRLAYIAKKQYKSLVDDEFTPLVSEIKLTFVNW